MAYFQNNRWGEVKERLTKVDWLSVLFQTRPCMKHQILCGEFSLSVSHQNTQSLMHEHFRILNFCYSYFSVSLACTSVRSSLCNCTSLFESDTVCSSDLTQLEIKSILFELAKNAPNSTQKDLCSTWCWVRCNHCTPTSLNCSITQLHSSYIPVCFSPQCDNKWLKKREKKESAGIRLRWL